MKDGFFFRHGIRMAGISAFVAMILFTLVAILSYRGDKRLIGLWEGYLSAEEQLFLLRVDSNRLFEIEHRLTAGGVNLSDDLKKAGKDLGKVPSLEKYSSHKLELLDHARNSLLLNEPARARQILESPEMRQVEKDLRDALFQYEINDRRRLQDRLGNRISSQEETLEFDIAAIVLAGVLLLSASLLVFFYVGRLRRYDRELVKARHEAERASGMKSSFLANMSHEIRTPLNGVLGLTRLLRETKLDSDQEDLVESLEASGRTLLMIVNDILDLSKIESGKIEIETIDFDVRALLDDIEKVFRVTAERKRLRFLLEGPSDSVFVRGDTTKIRQVAQNLISNALKFTREGEVRVRWRLEGGARGPFMRFEVRDSGIGIPEEALYRIFHPFEQADSSTSRHYGGSGLGLAICRHLVDAMGGEIGVESRVGLGSLFWFTIPYTPAEHPVEKSWAASAASPAAITRTPVQGLKVLLVEDNEVNQHLVVSFLDRRGFKIEAAGNGVEALQMLRQQDFDLILMDAHLPEMDGFEATKRIRAGEAGTLAQGLPIIALTASAVTGERERCLGVGMTDFMTKPVDLDLLEKTIRATAGGNSGEGGSAAKSEEGAGTPAKRVLPHDLDEELFGELVAIFRRVTPDRVKELKTAVETKSWKLAGRSAHTMKSSAAQLGLWALSEVCKKMEAKGFAEDGDNWAPLVMEFEETLRVALKDLP